MTVVFNTLQATAAERLFEELTIKQLTLYQLTRNDARAIHFSANNTKYECYIYEDGIVADMEDEPIFTVYNTGDGLVFLDPGEVYEAPKVVYETGDSSEENATDSSSE